MHRRPHRQAFREGKLVPMTLFRYILENDEPSRAHKDHEILYISNVKIFTSMFRFHYDYYDYDEALLGSDQVSAVAEAML
jgi:hypothetical protein